VDTKGSIGETLAYSANRHGTNLINWIGELKVWDGIHSKEENQTWWENSALMKHELLYFDP